MCLPNAKTINSEPGARAIADEMRMLEEETQVIPFRHDRRENAGQAPAQ